MYDAGCWGVGCGIFPAVPESARLPLKGGKRPLRQLPPADELKDERVGLAAAARAAWVLVLGFTTKFEKVSSSQLDCLHETIVSREPSLSVAAEIPFD